MGIIVLLLLIHILIFQINPELFDKLLNVYSNAAKAVIKVFKNGK